MSEATLVRTYNKPLLDEILRDERKTTKTASLTGIVDELIKKEAKRRGIK